MLRWEVTAVKGSLAAFLSFAFYMADSINEVTVVLIFAMALDLISGLFRAWITKTANSTICLAGIIKKFSVIVILAMTAAIEFLFIHIGQDTNGYVLLGVTCFFIVNEALSVLENFAQIGVPIPAILYNALEKLNKDPAGKEHSLTRDPALEKVDKAKLIQEVQQMQKEIISKDKKEDKQ